MLFISPKTHEMRRMNEPCNTFDCRDKTVSTHPSLISPFFLRPFFQLLLPLFLFAHAILGALGQAQIVELVHWIAAGGTGRHAQRGIGGIRAIMSTLIGGGRHGWLMMRVGRGALVRGHRCFIGHRRDDADERHGGIGEKHAEDVSTGCEKSRITLICRKEGSKKSSRALTRVDISGDKQNDRELESFRRREIQYLAIHVQS